MAHKQIWDNFLFEERFIPDASPKDILIIFEDDAYSVVKNITWSLENEFKNGMDKDLIFLGWCHGHKKGQIPSCAHAYAYTREGLKKMIKEIDTCGTALDGQFTDFIKRGIITWRKAKYESYSGNALIPGESANIGAFRGIFKQAYHLSSFNYH
jgi:hypothetical protein